MKETRKPYTVASYEAGKVPELRNSEVFGEIEGFTYLREETDGWVFTGGLKSNYRADWTKDGYYFEDGDPCDLDLFEKED